MYYTVKFRNGDDVQVVRMDEFPVENAFDAVLQATLGPDAPKVDYNTRVTVEVTYEGNRGLIMPVEAFVLPLKEPLSVETASKLWGISAVDFYKKYGLEEESG